MGEYRIKPWEELTMKDDYMFKRVLRREDICKGMLERILEISIQKIVYLEEEKGFKMGYSKHGVRLDVYVKDDENTVYNVEMQVRQLSVAEFARRTRFYQSLIDADSLLAGVEYEDLSNTIIIFICTFDPFGKGRHIYTFENYCKQDKELALTDGATKIFLSTKGRMDDVSSEVKAFLAYLEGTMSEDGFVREIEKEVQKIKMLEEERVSYMTYEMKMREVFKDGREEGRLEGRAEGRLEGRAEGRAEGREETMMETALAMIREGMSLPFIERVTKLPLPRLQELAERAALV